jgi:hypothetical protein
MKLNEVVKLAKDMDKWRELYRLNKANRYY